MYEQTRLPLPVELPIWGLASWNASRQQLRELLGPPHFVETDPSRTTGGEQDAWAYQFASGQRLLIIWDETSGWAELFADPPELSPVLQELGISDDDRRLKHHEPFEIERDRLVPRT